jgi:hypothetical protein
VLLLLPVPPRSTPLTTVAEMVLAGDSIHKRDGNDVRRQGCKGGKWDEMLGMSHQMESRRWEWGTNGDGPNEKARRI